MPTWLHGLRRQLISFSYFDACPTVRERQRQTWIPLLERLTAQLGTPIRTTNDLTVLRQDRELCDTISGLLARQSVFHLVGLECLTKAFKSCLLAVGNLLGLINAEEAIAASQLEVNLQAEKWGTLADFHEPQLSRLHTDVRLGMLLITLPPV